MMMMMRPSENAMTEPDIPSAGFRWRCTLCRRLVLSQDWIEGASHCESVDVKGVLAAAGNGRAKLPPRSTFDGITATAPAGPKRGRP